MNETMKHNLNRQLSSVEWTVEDAQAVRLRIQEEERPVKKKLSVGLVFAIVLVLMATAALAAASHAGLLDFLSRYDNAYIPQDAQSYILTDVASFDSETLSISVRESYFDGRSIRMTVDVAPKQANTLLISDDCFMEDPWQDLINLQQEQIDTSDTRSILEASTGYEQVHRVGVYIAEGETPSESLGGTGDYVLNPETGVLTFYLQESHERDREQRHIKLSIISRAVPDNTEVERLSYPLTLNAVQAETLVYECTTPALFETAGVRVDRLLIEVKPQDIYATIDYTVLKNDYGYIGIEDSLWFEFVDPDSTATEPYKQLLADGLTGFAQVSSMGGGRFIQRTTIGRNELRDSYILRAYDAFEKNRFDSCTFIMQPVTNK